MKKRNLLLFSLLCLLFFGQTAMVNAQCDIVIDMEDSYGDGWNGASVKVYDGADLLGTATLTGNTSSGSETITAPDMTDISFVWTAGDYASECGFTVTNGIGIDVYVCEPTEAPDPGEFLVITNVCSSVGLDVNLFDFSLASIVAVGEVEIAGTIRSERDTPITSFDVVYSLDGANSSVFTFEDLDIAFNTTYEFTHPELAEIEVGDHTIELTVENINGAGDDDNPGNNALTSQVLCVNEIFSKNVVYEEGTGTWCGWCPRGLVGLNTMAHDYTDGTWIGIGVHNGTNDPMKVTEYDNGIGGFISGYPSGVMNREDVFDPGLSSLEPAYMAAKQEIPLGKIVMTAQTWDAGTRELTVEATTNFAMDLTGTSYNLSMVIVESGMSGTSSGWNQANYYSGGGNGDLIDFDGTNWADLANPVPAADMVYQHVGRVLVGGWDGIPNVIPADVVYGTPYTYEFTHTLADDFNAAEIDLVVMLIDATTGVIVNAYELPLGAEVLIAGFSADVVEGVAPLEVNFTDESQGDITEWSWDFDNDGTEDSDEQNPTYIFETGGFHSVALTVTSSTGLINTIVEEDFVHTSGVGLEEVADNKFKCYPNPASDVINVQSEEALTGIKIWNVGGQVVYANENSSNIQTIDVANFKKGVFFMELNTENETKIIKIVID